MAVFLPLELITEILTKLPVKSLNRFKCVSKTWNSIITSSKFIKHHLHQTLISNTNFNIIISNNNALLSSASSAVELRFDIINHPLNNLPDRPPVKIIESVHGILLIVDSSKKTVCLFNPSNKTQRLVPLAPSHMPACDGLEIAEVFGFGYDGITDDYKVVRLAQWELFGFFEREASVYSMRNDSWESVNDETVSHTLQETSAMVVDSRLWFVMILSNGDRMLKCFDLRTSTFSLVDLPELDRDSGKVFLCWRSLRGCLCFLVSYRKKNNQFLFGDVWEMNNEYKWVKLFKIRKDEIRKHCSFLRLVTYSKDMKSVLIELDCSWHGWYDLVTKKFNKVRVQGLGAVNLPYFAYPYVETLVSVVNDKVASNKEGTTRPKKTIEKKNHFLSCGFKLML